MLFRGPAIFSQQVEHGDKGANALRQGKSCSLQCMIVQSYKSYRYSAKRASKGKDQRLEFMDGDVSRSIVRTATKLRTLSATHALLYSDFSRFPTSTR